MAQLYIVAKRFKRYDSDGYLGQGHKMKVKKIITTFHFSQRLFELYSPNLAQWYLVASRFKRHTIMTFTEGQGHWVKCIKAFLLYCRKLKVTVMKLSLMALSGKVLQGKKNKTKTKTKNPAYDSDLRPDEG